MRAYINLHATYVVYEVQNFYPIFLVYPLVLLFASACRDQIRAFRDYRIHIAPTLFFSLSALAVFSIPLSYFVDRAVNPILMHYAPLYLGYILLFIAIFGVNFVRSFRKELLLISGISYGLLGFFMAAESYWKFLSYGIVRALSVILPFFSKNVHIRMSDFNVKLEAFSVNIGAPCAGTYSLLFFIIFFGLSLFFLYRQGRIRYGYSLFVFVAGFVVLFLLNTLRIAIILMVGGYYSPQIAMSIFHEYLGSIFFMAFLLMYFSYIMPHLVVSPQKPLSAL